MDEPTRAFGAVLVTGAATFSKSGRLLSIADVTVLPWDPPAAEVQE